jgi:hypothetical protein
MLPETKNAISAVILIIFTNSVLMSNTTKLSNKDITQKLKVLTDLLIVVNLAVMLLSVYCLKTEKYDLLNVGWIVMAISFLATWKADDIVKMIQ